MAGAIKASFSNPDESNRWRERGLRRAADFSWKKAAEQAIAVYQRITGSFPYRKLVLPH
jgi:glycosyltransferase involved in cell wall biosynthesis